MRSHPSACLVESRASPPGRQTAGRARRPSLRRLTHQRSRYYLVWWNLAQTPADRRTCAFSFYLRSVICAANMPQEEKKKEKGTRFWVPSLYTSGCSLGRRGLDACNVDGVARCIQRSRHFDFLSDELLGLVGIVQFVRGACVILQHQVAFGFVNLPHKRLGLLTLVGLLAHRGLGLRWLGLRCRIQIGRASCRERV